MVLGPLGAIAGYYLFLIVNPGVSVTFPSYILEATVLTFITISLVSGGKNFAEKGYVSQMKLSYFKALATEARERAKELRRRDDILSSYIQPSILAKINAGEDPRDSEHRLVHRAIFYTDLRRFSSTILELDSGQTPKFLNRYFRLMHQPIYQHEGEVDKLMGDATLASFPNGKQALKAAISLRKRLQKYNRRVIRLGQNKLDNVICICKGEIIEGNFGDTHRLDYTFIGQAVTACARMEPIAKFFDTPILATEDVIDDWPEYYDKRLVVIVKLKGIDKKQKLYEIFGHQAPSVVEYKRATKDILEKALTIYFQNKGIGDAGRIFKAMLNKMPKHLHSSQLPMDPIIQHYLARCNEWRRSPEKWQAAIEKWDGCHDFKNGFEWSDWTAIQVETADKLQ